MRRHNRLNQRLFNKKKEGRTCRRTLGWGRTTGSNKARRSKAPLYFNSVSSSEAPPCMCVCVCVCDGGAAPCKVTGLVYDVPTCVCVYVCFGARSCAHMTVNVSQARIRTRAHTCALMSCSRAHMRTYVVHLCRATHTHTHTHKHTSTHTREWPTPTT